MVTTLALQTRFQACTERIAFSLVRRKPIKVSLELQQKKRWKDRHTFKSAKSIEGAIFARLGLVDPAWVAKGRRILLMIEVQRDK
jgi:hypothetical protein